MEAVYRPGSPNNQKAGFINLPMRYAAGVSTAPQED